MAAMSTKPWYIFLGFRLQISSWWMWTIIAASIAHSLLVFLEPPPGKPPEEGWLGPRTLLLLESIFIAVYAMDVALKASYMGLKSYVKKPWQKLMIAIVLLLAVDASGVVGVRFARALRPGNVNVKCFVTSSCVALLCSCTCCCCCCWSYFGCGRSGVVCSS